MLFKSFSLLISLGQAAQILRGKLPEMSTFSDSPTPGTQVNGTLSSFNVIEGNGCPAGTYHAQPIEPGKSLNSYVEFDPTIFSYNSTTSSEPAMCTLSIDFEFVYPEDGQAIVVLDTVTYNDAKFEEGDIDRVTGFALQFDVLVTAGDEEIDAGTSATRYENDGPIDTQFGAVLFPVGTPGEVAVGTFQLAASIYTSEGPGEYSISRIDLGFGLYYQEI